MKTGRLAGMSRGLEFSVHVKLELSWPEAPLKIKSDFISYLRINNSKRFQLKHLFIHSIGSCSTSCYKVPFKARLQIRLQIRNKQSLFACTLRPFKETGI